MCRPCAHLCTDYIQGLAWGGGGAVALVDCKCRRRSSLPKSMAFSVCVRSVGFSSRQHLVLVPFFYRLQIGVAFFSWASFDHRRRRDLRRTESSWARQISFSSDLTKLRLSPVQWRRRTKERTNATAAAAAKRLWRFVTGVKAAARDLGPSTSHARTAAHSN